MTFFDKNMTFFDQKIRLLNAPKGGQRTGFLAKTPKKRHKTAHPPGFYPLAQPKIFHTVENFFPQCGKTGFPPESPDASGEASRPWNQLPDDPALRPALPLAGGEIHEPARIG